MKQFNGFNSIEQDIVQEGLKWAKRRNSSSRGRRSQNGSRHGSKLSLHSGGKPANKFKNLNFLKPGKGIELSSKELFTRLSYRSLSSNGNRSQLERSISNGSLGR